VRRVRLRSNHGSPNWFDRIKSSARNVGCKPWFSGCTAVVGTLAGFFAAIYADEIRNAFPFSPDYGVGWHGAIAWHAVQSWTAVAMFGFMFGLNSWALTSTADIQIEKLQGSSAELHQVIRTLPPQNFLQGFQDYLMDAYPVVVKGAEASGNLQEIREGILAVLTNLACMAKLFDSHAMSCLYCANIMIFRRLGDLSREDRSALARRAMFTEQREPEGGGWEGVVELVPSLAVFVEGERIFFEESLPSFVLEIPSPAERFDAEGRKAFLPGGPEAFCEEGPSYCPDTHLMGDTCRKERALRPVVSTAMDRYFKEGHGQDVRSFISIPILPSGCVEPQGSEPLGVVNIHCNQTEMLRNRHGVELFVPVTTPHLLFIAHLLEKLLKIEGKGPI